LIAALFLQKSQNHAEIVFEESGKISSEILPAGTVLMAKHFYKFGPYSLDPEERVLRRGDQPVAVPPKDLETLIVLVERAGHIVDKEELFEKVWPGVFIEEGNLSRRIFNLRQVLGDGADGLKYIETIPRRGYRFVAPLQQDQGHAPPTPSPASAPAADPAQKQAALPAHRNKAFWLWSVAIIVVVAVIGGLAARHFLGGHAGKVMLAVLPFANLSGDATNDYFADGFTEEMITQLGQLQPARLGVIARTSAMRYKSSQLSAAQISQELGVNYLLEGSVRQAGDRVRITAQLIQASDQTHLWAESYDAPSTDVLRVQQEIATRITDSLRFELLPHAGTTPDLHLDPAAYREYLLGLNESRKGTRAGGEKAIEYFQSAIKAEPRNARFYAALAQSYSRAVPYYSPPAVTMPLAKQAAQKALELDPRSATAQAILGDSHLLFDWDWKSAEAAYRRALEINPSSPEAHLGYANYFSTLGRHDEALAQVQQVYVIDPLAVDARIEAIWVYFFSGRMEETVAQAKKTIELEPQAGYPYALLALSYSQMGRSAEVLQAAQRAAEVSDSPSVLVVAASALARVGQRDLARKFVDRALDLANSKYVCRFLLAAAYVDLDEKEKALESLERGLREKST
jgi:TolB-like protein/DNA-binding winged helix-turn-helix (wHTH) protein/Flp pilus assembly protein TadD